jgi:hypothetical protein
MKSLGTSGLLRPYGPPFNGLLIPKLFIFDDIYNWNQFHSRSMTLDPLLCTFNSSDYFLFGFPLQIWSFLDQDCETSNRKAELLSLRVKR